MKGGKIMNVENKEVTAAEEPGGAITAESPSEVPPVTDEARAFAEKSAEMERQQAELREQDKKLLEALDNVLEQNSIPPVVSVNRTKAKPKFKLFVGTAVNRGAGFLSLGLILIFMGVVALICLLSPEPNYMILMKLSPICAIMIGLDLIVHLAFNRGKIYVNIPSLIISALIMAGGCMMSVTLNQSYTEQEVLYNNRSIAGELYELSYDKLSKVADIETLNIEVNLNPDGTGKYKGTLSADDYVTVNVTLAGVYSTPKAFAVECKKVIDGYKKMDVNVNYFNFSNDSEFNSYRLSLEGKYAQDFSISRLEERVNYIYIESNEFALNDLEDYDDED